MRQKVIYSSFFFLFIALRAASADDLNLKDVPDASVCRDALKLNRSEWETLGKFANEVVEAKRRGFTIDKCNSLIDVSSRSLGLPEDVLCRDALSSDGRSWDTSNAFSEKVDEAKRRGLNVDKCRAVLGEGPPANTVDTDSQSGVFDVSKLLTDSKNAKKLAASDLAIQTHKWDGRLIQTTLNCIYADRKDFRCTDLTTFSKIRIDFREFDEQGQSFIENNCDTQSSSASRLCRIDIRFIYSGFDEMEVGGLLGKITIVSPQGGVGRVVNHGH